MMKLPTLMIIPSITVYTYISIQLKKHIVHMIYQCCHLLVGGTLQARAFHGLRQPFWPRHFLPRYTMFVCWAKNLLTLLCWGAENRYSSVV